MRSLMTRCERVQASLYDVCGSTTAGTSSTVPAPHAFALRSEVSMPATLLATTAGSALEIGERQCSMFITEWMAMPLAADAARAASTSAASVSVCISIASKPAVFAAAKRSANGPGGSIEISTARLGIAPASGRGALRGLG